jgi:hypothetical protein
MAVISFRDKGSMGFKVPMFFFCDYGVCEGATIISVLFLDEAKPTSRASYFMTLLHAAQIKARRYVRADSIVDVSVSALQHDYWKDPQAQRLGCYRVRAALAWGLGGLTRRWAVSEQACAEKWCAAERDEKYVDDRDDEVVEKEAGEQEKEKDEGEDDDGEYDEHGE